jgi:adenosylhomocysteine nucleosidase
MDGANESSGRPQPGLTRIGILAAMYEELEAVLPDLRRPSTEFVIGRTFHRGVLHGHEAVAVVAGIGKTAVATTTTLLIQHFGAGVILLTGAAGRVSEELAVGDVVIASHLVHHDLDASPIFPRYHVPTLGIAELATDTAVSALAHAAAEAFIAEEASNGAKVARGLVLSGDQFMGPAALADLRRRFPEGLAVEMEGAAVAQVCIEAQTPFAVVRSISDDGDAASFERFLRGDCGRYARGIVGRLLIAMH